MATPATIHFECTCGRSVVTEAGTDADVARRCTRCRLRLLRRGASTIVRAGA